MTALHGGCLCGCVRFEIDGPLLRSSHCHCRQCQKAHGAPFRCGVLARLCQNRRNG